MRILKTMQAGAVVTIGTTIGDCNDVGAKLQLLGWQRQKVAVVVDSNGFAVDRYCIQCAAGKVERQIRRPIRQIELNIHLTNNRFVAGSNIHKRVVAKIRDPGFARVGGDFIQSIGDRPGNRLLLAGTKE